MTATSSVVACAPNSPDDERARVTAELLETAVRAGRSRRATLLQQVVLMNITLADRAARRYRNRGVADEDLIQVSRLGLVKAAYGFDPGRGATFVSYALPTVLGELRRYFRDQAWLVRPPRRIQELQAELNVHAEDCVQRNGHGATVDDLAAASGRRREDVIQATTADGCFAPRSLDWATDDGLRLGDQIGCDEPGYDVAETNHTLRAAITQLSERDKRL